MNLHNLEAKNISKYFVQGDKTLNVLQNISYSFEQGKTYAITGVSGSGKSTLMHILGGLDIPNSGTIFFGEHNIHAMRAKKKDTLLNTGLGFVFQFHYLINELTVQENIMLMGLIKGESKQVCAKHAQKLLDHVGLTSKATSYPFELSGGEQQRISILRAIFNKPHFLLADEPTGNLDAQNAEHIVNLFLQCKQEWNMGLILCTHDQAVYNKMEKVLHLHEGSLIPQK